MEIPVYRLPYSKEDIQYIQSHVARILQRGYLTDGGEYLKQFEEEAAQYFKAKNAIAVNSCTTALELILKCINVTGHSVIVPTYTFYATPMSVINAGGKVLYADINCNTLSLSLESIQHSVRKDTKAVIIVHIGGIISDEIVKIRKFCDNNKIFLIEDAACAHGSTFNKKSAGSFGHASAFSFHHSKVLTSGEGGLIITSNSDWAYKLRKMRAIGLDREINNWEAFEIGSNYKLPELSALLGLFHINKANEILSERRLVASYYDENIHFNNNVLPFILPEGSVSSYYKYIIKVSSVKYKSEIRRKLKNCQLIS